MRTSLIVVLFGLASVAAGQSLKEKNQRKEEAALLQARVDTTNEACKTKLKPAWDWQSFKGRLKGPQGEHVGVYCGQVLEAMAGLCHGGDEAKEAIRAGVTTVLCKGTEEKLSEVRYDKGKKTVVFATRIDDERTGVKHYVQEYLEENL
jgi:hypothetical protein